MTLFDSFSKKSLEIRQSEKYPFYRWCLENVEGYKTESGNLSFRAKVIESCMTSEDSRRSYWSMCARDILFYINTFGWTYDPRLAPSSTIIPFITYDFQDVAIDESLEAVYNKHDLLTEKSRDQGASWLVAYRDEWFWHFSPFLFSALIGSRTEEYVDNPSEPKSLFWKIDFIHKNLPGWFLPERKRVFKHLENLQTGSTIGGESTTGDFARGGRWTLIDLDEFASVEPEGAKVLNATRDATKSRFFNSTHQGAGTSFYRLSKTKIRKLQLHWSLHPMKRRGLYYSINGQLVLVDQDFRGTVEDYEGKKWLFPDEYPFRLDGKLRSPYYDYECDRSSHPMEIAQELDMDPFASDSMFFDSRIEGQNMVDYIEKNYVREPVLQGYLEYDPDSLEPIEFIIQPNGPLKLWIPMNAEGRLPENLNIGIGTDIAAGTGASNSTHCIGDMDTGEKIGEFVSAFIKPEAFARMTVALAKWCNQAYLCWDGAGMGRIFGDTIIESGYRNIYYQRSEDRIGKKQSDKPGYFLNPEPKRAVLGQLRKDETSGHFIQRSSVANQERLCYIYTTRNTVEHSSEYNSIDPSGAKSAHGDLVIADALFNHIRALRGTSRDELFGKQYDDEFQSNSYAAYRMRREAALRREKEW